MLVKYWMSKDLITAKATDSVIKAKLLLKEHNISHLPVMEKTTILYLVDHREHVRKMFDDSRETV